MTTRRKRAVVLRPLARLTGRDAVWAVIRQLATGPAPEFTQRDIMRCVTSGPDLVADYLARLVAAGIVAVVTPGRRFLPATHRLVRDCGVEAPRVTKAGTIDDTPSDQERLWQAMKVLPSFDARDLMASTGTASRPSVLSYIKHLSRAGYLVTVEAATPRRLGRYRLIPSRNTGPHPPAVRQGKIVFDRNLGRQVWPEVTP